MQWLRCPLEKWRERGVVCGKYWPNRVSQLVHTVRRASGAVVLTAQHEAAVTQGPSSQPRQCPEGHFGLLSWLLKQLLGKIKIIIIEIPSMGFIP